MSVISTTFANMQGIIDAIPNPIFVKDRNHRIVLLNDSACDLFGYSRETLLSQPDDCLFSKQEVAVFRAADDRAFASGKPSENEEVITDGNGVVRHVITRKRLTTLDGHVYLIGSLTDVSALRAIERQNHYLEYYDLLTGLPNQSMLAQRIEQALSQRHHGCALIHIYLDRLTEATIVHSQPAPGDALILEFSRRMSMIIKGSDTVARLGGDEFAVLLADTSKDPNADEICRRVLTAAAQTFYLANAQVRIRASIGVVLTGMEPITVEELQRRADVALYQSKSESHGSFRIFTQALDDRVNDRHGLTTDLREALASGAGLHVYYQPLVDIVSRRVIGFEALARWTHTIRGSVPPSLFIPAAEATGLILELGEWVLLQACQAAALWKPALRLSVNISPIQFVSGDLAETVARILRESGLEASRLELEITEGVLTEDPASALLMLNELRATGVQIVLDDFGTGYSSLSYFRQFPFDKIKIDRSFVSDILNSKRALSIVQAVISLARGLDLEVLAEGVETEDQLRLLTEHGCTQAQGFLLGKPMPIQQFVGSALMQA